MGVLLGLWFFILNRQTESYIPHPEFEEEAPDVDYFLRENIRLGAGINLGNSLDCYSAKPLANALYYETYWKNPVITPDLLQLIRDSGFQVVRIPVTWDQHFLEDGTTIDPVWMKRVQEVVDDALSCGLYVVLDVHHDVWANADPDNYETAAKMADLVWGQIAETFVLYDEHLIFEGFNELQLSQETEEASRLKEAYEMVNRLNTIALETVRAAGGENEKRWIILPTYGNRCSKECLEAMADWEDDRVMVSVHLYIPYKFTGKNNTGTGTPFWSASDTSSVHSIEEAIDALVWFQRTRQCKVIVTEMGAVDKNNPESREAWTTYVTSRLRAASISYLWWEDTYHEGESGTYSILNRWNNTLLHPNLVQILVDGQ